MMMRRRRSRSRSRRRREVLIAIRDGTSHANWKDKKTGWDKLEQYTKMEDFESCRGVQTKGGKLTKIDLTDCNLVRSFPAALAKLDTLVDTLLDTLVVLYPLRQRSPGISSGTSRLSARLPAFPTSRGST
jgi:hypothetical protein